MNNFSEQLFNQELPPIVTGGLPKRDLKQTLPQIIHQTKDQHSPRIHQAKGPRNPKMKWI